MEVAGPLYFLGQSLSTLVTSDPGTEGLASSTLTVHVSDDVSVLRGQDAILGCSFTHPKQDRYADNITLSWIGRSEKTTPFFQCTVKNDSSATPPDCLAPGSFLLAGNLRQGNASLRISAVQVKDEGVYFCKVELEKGGSQKKKLMLKVQGKDSTQSLDFLFGHKGGVAISVNAEKLFWGDPLLYGSTPIVCKLQMQFSTRRHLFLLLLSVRPAILSLSMVTGSSSAPNRLQCVAEGLPLPNITWLSAHGQPLATALAAHVKTSFARWYLNSSIPYEGQEELTCRVENALGRAEGTYRPANTLRDVGLVCGVVAVAVLVLATWGCVVHRQKLRGEAMTSSECLRRVALFDDDDDDHDFSHSARNGNAQIRQKDQRRECEPFYTTPLVHEHIRNYMNFGYLNSYYKDVNTSIHSN